VAERKSTASKEGFKVLQDQDLLNGVEARARQLEAERAAHMLTLSEEEALENEQAIESTKNTIKMLEARLTVVHGRREALKSNMPGDKTDKTETATG
jgi:hypothetical protein